LPEPLGPMTECSVPARRSGSRCSRRGGRRGHRERLGAEDRSDAHEPAAKEQHDHHPHRYFLTRPSLWPSICGYTLAIFNNRSGSTCSVGWHRCPPAGALRTLELSTAHLELWQAWPRHGRRVAARRAGWGVRTAAGSHGGGVLRGVSPEPPHHGRGCWPICLASTWLWER